MAYFLETISHSTTGTKNRTVGFQAKGIRITVGQKSGTTQTFAHKSEGVSDGTNQICDTFFQDTTGGKTERYSNKIVSHWERVSGTLTEKTAAHVDTATAPWTATAIAYIVDTADVNYQYRIEAWD